MGLNELEKQLIDMYKREINRVHCMSCDEKKKDLPKGYDLCFPQTLWHVGDKFRNNNVRLVFVGKTSWNTKVDLSDDIVIQTESKSIVNCFNMGKEWFKEPEGNRYWLFIKDVTQSRGLTLDDIAISNLVKCNVFREENNTYKDLTGITYYQNCMKIFEKEMQIIKPSHIIFLTHTEFDDLINGLRFWFDNSYWYYKDVHDMYYTKLITKRTEINVKNQQSHWWHREFYNDGYRNNIELHFLRTRHPQFMPDEFKTKMIEWIKYNSSKSK